jgi:hypothetical protein
VIGHANREPEQLTARQTLGVWNFMECREIIEQIVNVSKQLQALPLLALSVDQLRRLHGSLGGQTVATIQQLELFEKQDQTNLKAERERIIDQLRRSWLGTGPNETPPISTRSPRIFVETL